jgi:hypothetical protein
MMMPLLDSIWDESKVMRMGNQYSISLKRLKAKVLKVVDEIFGLELTRRAAVSIVLSRMTKDIHQNYSSIFHMQQHLVVSKI